MVRRRVQVLDAAIEVLGAGGAKRLTYQAVDQAAGVAAGTTSNYFRTRKALISGIVEHLEALDRRDWEMLAGTPGPTGVEEMTAAMAGFVRYATGPAISRTAARYALFLEAVARPELAEPLTRGRASIIGWGIDWIRALGSPEPEAHCRILLDYLDGVILRQVSFPEPGFTAEPGVRMLLEALLASRQEGAPAEPRGAPSA